MLDPSLFRGGGPEPLAAAIARLLARAGVSPAVVTEIGRLTERQWQQNQESSSRSEL